MKGRRKCYASRQAKRCAHGYIVWSGRWLNTCFQQGWEKGIHIKSLQLWQHPRPERLTKPYPFNMYTFSVYAKVTPESARDSHLTLNLGEILVRPLQSHISFCSPYTQWVGSNERRLLRTLQVAVILCGVRAFVLPQPIRRVL